MSALDLDAVRKRLNAGLRAALTDDCAQVITADLRAFMAHEAGLRMRELLWASSDAGWRELIAVLEADGKPEGAAVDYVLALITRLRAAEARTADLRAGLERVTKRCAEGGEQALAEAQCALDYQVGGLRNGQQDPTICPACGFDKTATAEKEHGG